MRHLDRLILNAVDELEMFDDSFEYDQFDEALDEALDEAIAGGTAVRPGTKCTEAEHNSYYARVNRACKGVDRGFSCTSNDTVEQLFAKSAAAQACATAR